MFTNNLRFGGKILSKAHYFHKNIKKATISSLQSYDPNVNATEPINFDNLVPKETSPPIFESRQYKVLQEAYDSEIMELVHEETERQIKSVDLIASSNVPFAGINELTNVLGNKSSPGYPSGRFFNGDAVIDKIEKL
jgi:hypothetical protein